MTLDAGSLTPVFKRIHDFEKKGSKCSSLDHHEPANASKQSTPSDRSSDSSYVRLIRRVLQPLANIYWPGARSA